MKPKLVIAPKWPDSERDQANHDATVGLLATYRLMHKRLARVLPVLRERHQISVRDLARLSGVDAGYISRIERNRKVHPSVLVLKKLERALERWSRS